MQVETGEQAELCARCSLLIERDKLKAENERLKEALGKIVALAALEEK